MFRTLTAAALTCAMMTTAVLAQDDAPRVTNGQNFGSWNVACDAVAVNETACVLNQQLLRSSDNVFLAQLLAFWTADASKRYMAVRVPVGVYLPAGFAMRPDPGEEVTTFTWQSCNAQICEALIELTDEQIAAMDAADTRMVASYRPSLRMEPVVFNFAMTGLTDGLEALKPAAKAE